MRRNDTKRLALAGVLAALAVVIMCLGGLIPFATYVCPMLCAMTLFVILRFCGKRFSWIWFAVVAFLSLLMGPDKEAAIVFLFIGYYPLIKYVLEKHKLSMLMKFLFFNVAVFLAYSFLSYVIGMDEVLQENLELGIAGLLLLMVLGNATFFLLDKLLTIMARKIR